MKKLFLICLLVLAVSASGAQYYNANFLDTAVAVNAGITSVNGTDFASKERPTSNNAGLITITFTRAAGSASTVNFYFQVSFDGGTTWSDYIESISIETQHSVISGTTVRVSKPVNLWGISYMRLSKIVNGDTANNLTAVNATISY